MVLPEEGVGATMGGGKVLEGAGVCTEAGKLEGKETHGGTVRGDERGAVDDAPNGGSEDR